MQTINPLKTNTQKKQKKAKQLVYQGRLKDITALEAYHAALVSPFNPLAIGAQVPDLYSYPTSTYHAEGTMVISSNASGVASVALFPHPYCSAIDMTTASISSTGMAQYTTNNPSFYAAATLANMTAVLQNYRVVGGGVQIRNLQPPTSATGRAIVCPVPVVGSAPGPNILNSTAIVNANSLFAMTGVSCSSTTVGIPSDLLELPSAQELTVQDLISETLQVNFKPCGPSAFDFRPTNPSAGYGNSVNENSDVPYGAVSGLINANGGNFLTNQVVGWDGIMLRFEGLPVSTSNCIEIKYVLHFEGTPSFTNAAGALTPGCEKIGIVDPIAHSAVVSSALNTPQISLISDVLYSGVTGYLQGGMS